MTVIDLSDPFIDPASAAGLFDIVLRLFIRADVGTGKVCVVDEAHKVSCLELPQKNHDSAFSILSTCPPKTVKGLLRN